jgi:hypothetical protein
VELHQRYGSVVRYGPRMLSFSDPGAVREIYTTGDPFPKVCCVFCGEEKSRMGVMLISVVNVLWSC